MEKDGNVDAMSKWFETENSDKAMINGTLTCVRYNLFSGKRIAWTFKFWSGDFWISYIYRKIIVSGYDISTFTLNHDKYRIFTISYRNGS